MASYIALGLTTLVNWDSSTTQMVRKKSQRVTKEKLEMKMLTYQRIYVARLGISKSGKNGLSQSRFQFQYQQELRRSNSVLLELCTQWSS